MMQPFQFDRFKDARPFRRPRPVFSRVRAVLLAILLSSCVAMPTGDELRRGPSPHLLPGAPQGIVDGRQEFRNNFCKSLEQTANAELSADDCETWLLRLSDETAGPAQTGGRTETRLQILFVTGAFSECFGESARPFGSAITKLSGEDYRFGTIEVGGQSGTDHNAAQIATFLDEWPTHPDTPLILVGYSKGTSDILQFLVDYPLAAERVDAVISVSGAVRGSPLADRFDTFYRLLFSHLPSGHCEKGDGDVVHSLRTDVRKEWLKSNPLPDTVRYYSLAAFTTKDRMARALIGSWKILLGESPRNDGQLLPQDALIPGSTLLGYLNADHWSVAMEFEADHEFFAGRRDPTPFPHKALLQAMLWQVGNDLATRE
jgi:hypothetical protein